MSHIDLYSELSLDRSMDSDEIDRRLAQQLAETPESDNAVSYTHLTLPTKA